MLEKLMPLVYNELRRLAHRYMAQERHGHVLQSTTLVHEADQQLMMPGTCCKRSYELR